MARGVVTRGTYSASDGAVRCPSPASYGRAAEAQNTTLQLAINSLHYVEVTPFEFYDDAHISSVSPSSGPVAGGAQLVMVGSGFGRGSHAQCWLGGGARTRRAMAGGSQPRCVSPPNSSVSAASTTVRVALNGQQASDESGFVFYAEPTPRSSCRITATQGRWAPARKFASSPTARITTEVAREGTGTRGFANAPDWRCMLGPNAGSITPPPSSLRTSSAATRRATPPSRRISTADCA